VNFSNAGTTAARTHNAANEITARTFAGNSRLVSYDDAGNLLTLQANSGTAGWRYTYDHRNRLAFPPDSDVIASCGRPQFVCGSWTEWPPEFS